MENKENAIYAVVQSSIKNPFRDTRHLYLYWLANGRTAGRQEWQFLDSPELRAAYENQLAAIGECGTIVASVSKD